MSRTLNCIVAVCPNLGIGNKGNLPWHPKRLSNEFKHFQKMTMTPSIEGKQNVVIMGRKTWFSIPEQNRPLKNRINVVLSRELKELPEGAHYLAHDFSSALSMLKGAELADKADQVWIIGGSAIYKLHGSGTGKTTRLLLNRAGLAPSGTSEVWFYSGKEEAMDITARHRLFVTRILQEFECDTFLPVIDLDKYKLLPEFPGVPTEIQEENGIQYKFEVYENTVSE